MEDNWAKICVQYRNPATACSEFVCSNLLNTATSTWHCYACCMHIGVVCLKPSSHYLVRQSPHCLYSYKSADDSPCFFHPYAVIETTGGSKAPRTPHRSHVIRCCPLVSTIHNSRSHLYVFYFIRTNFIHFPLYHYPHFPF